MTMGIYIIKNQTADRVYVGSSKDIERRFKRHKSSLNNNTHENSKLQEDWNLYGENDYSFNIICTVEDVNILPQKEYEYIEEMKNDYVVYNISNPLYECVRYEDRMPKPYKGKNNKRSSQYKHSQQEVLDWLKNNFTDTVEKMRSYIEKNKYIIKDKADEYFHNGIEDEDILNDDRIEGLINKFYNKQSFSIVQSKLYYLQFKKLGIDVPLEKHVLVSKKMSGELYRLKYNK